MVDFAALRRKMNDTTPEERVARREAAMIAEDDALFAGKKIQRMPVEIFDDMRHDVLGAKRIAAATEKGPIALVFPGYRGELVETSLIAEMATIRQDRMTAGADTAAAVMTIIVEGFWKKRDWTTKDGTRATAWDFLVAKWHYQPRGQGFVEIGSIPA